MLMLHKPFSNPFAVREVMFTFTNIVTRLPTRLCKLRYLHTKYCGLNLWEEELSQSTKLKIEEYWADKIQWPGYDADAAKDSKYYVLSMFPYPSGNLHMGHIRVYSISDTLARFYRMNGKNVLHPMGWDAFGLPAENAAIERGLSSEVWTKSNISAMKQQLKQLGCTFDWNREIATCHKEYYKFTQFIFLKLFEKGLAYRKKALVNWDPVDKTVLADEQVDADGCSWRSGAKVEKKILEQWYIRTTSFAKALYEGLDEKILENWHDIIDMQKQWVGECNGISFELPLSDHNREITLWTDKAEHLARAKFVAVPLGSVWDVESGGGGNRKLDVHVVNTLTGDLLPLFVTDELQFYKGPDGRIGIPEVYECDMEFARRVNLNLGDIGLQLIEDNVAERHVISEKINGRATSSNIRDWLISRQRHWGTPIPMVHCSACGVQPVPYDQLPVELCSIEKSTQDKSSTHCPKCGGPASKDTDTMDTFVDSSWYYLRYTDPHNQQEPFSKTAAASLMPVDTYVGGKEHAVLHLYYARFMSHFLHSLGWLPNPEPFKRLLVQGMIMGKTYRVKTSGKYISAKEVDLSGKIPVEKQSGEPVKVTWEKMSKSKLNGVDPCEMFREYGVDTTRLLVMSSVAPTSQRNWDESLFLGVLNWQRKIWLTVQEFRKARLSTDVLPEPKDLSAMELFFRENRNYHLRSISSSYHVTRVFNRAIAKSQGLVGHLRQYGNDYKLHSKEYERSLATLIILLSPLCPHFAAQLWSGLQELPNLKTTQEFDWTKQCHQQAWPSVDQDYKLQLTVSVNTAVKDALRMSRLELDQLTTSSATQLALASPEVRLYTNQTPVLDTEFKLYPGLLATLDLKLDHTKLHFDKDYYKNKKKDKKKIIKLKN